MTRHAPTKTSRPFEQRRLFSPGRDLCRALLCGLAASLICGCYDPKLDQGGSFRCATGPCPDGFRCNSDQVCVRRGAQLDGGGSGDSGAADAGVTDARRGPDGDPAGWCVAEPPVPVWVADSEQGGGVVGRFGLAFDESAATMRVAFATTTTDSNVRVLHVASLFLGQTNGSPAGWTTTRHDNIPSDTANNSPPFAAIDAHGGDYAVLFGSRTSEARIRTKDLGSIPLVANDGGKTLRGLEGAIRFTSAGELLSVIRRGTDGSGSSGDLEQLFMVRVMRKESSLLSQPPQAITPEQGADGLAVVGRFPRLAIHGDESEPQNGVAALAFLGMGGSIVERRISAFYGRWPLLSEPKDFNVVELPLGNPGTREELEQLAGLGMALDREGEPIVVVPAATIDDFVGLFTWEPRSSQPGEPAPLESLDEGEEFLDLGRPALALAPPAAGLATIDLDGVVLFSSSAGPDAPIDTLIFDDTEEFPSAQVEVVVSAVNDNTAFFDVVYLRSESFFGQGGPWALYHRLVTCPIQ